MMKTLTLGTRASALALAQTELTRSALVWAFPELEIRIETFVTQGDKKLDLNLLQRSPGGGKGLFTRELEEALLSRRIDVAVHSLKDLPGHMPEGLEIASVLERSATSDLLVSKYPGGLDALPHGALVGTSSIRRARHLQWLRGDLQVAEWRGNVQTRLRKLGESQDFAAIVLAEAGLLRLGFYQGGREVVFDDWRFEASSLGDRMYPAIGQGIIALQSEAGRLDVRQVLQSVNHAGTWLVVRAERELQRRLSGDCTLPVGVRTRLAAGGMEMEAVLFEEGRSAPRCAQARGEHPEAVAAEVAFGLGAGEP
ncbi:MAG: hydroxymethylbilane synthase [Verrucomicrobia bacterium]|nr:hydroxymethylbilane synthase [Verrucomicrobiota bacterium]